jgi:hypothetical protein
MKQDKKSPLLHWRAHHILLCGNSYVGKGYTDDYTARLNTMMHLVNQRDQRVCRSSSWKVLMTGASLY